MRRRSIVAAQTKAQEQAKVQTPPQTEKPVMKRRSRPAAKPQPQVPKDWI